MKQDAKMDYDAFKRDPILSRPLPNAVQYDLSKDSETTITLPPLSKWSSELHWHETHTEFLRVVKGTVRVRLGDRVSVVSASKDDEPPAIVRVDVGVRHEWSRADKDAPSDSKDDVEVIVVESTEPADVEKHLFFWNLNGTILETQNQAVRRPGYVPNSLWAAVLDYSIMLHLFIIFGALDNFPVLLDLSGHGSLKGVPGSIVKLMEWCVAHAVLSLASLLGRVLGYRAVEKKFTPDHLFENWTKSNASKEKKAV